MLVAHELTLKPAKQTPTSDANGNCNGITHCDSRGSSSTSSSHAGSPVANVRKNTSSTNTPSSASSSATVNSFTPTMNGCVHGLGLPSPSAGSDRFGRGGSGGGGAGTSNGGGSPVDVIPTGSDTASDARRILRGMPLGIGSGVRSDGGGRSLGLAAIGVGGMVTGRMLELSPLLSPKSGGGTNFASSAAAAAAAAVAAVASGDAENAAQENVVLSQVMGAAAPHYSRIWSTLVRIQQADPFPAVADAADSVVELIVQEASRWFSSEGGGGANESEERDEAVLTGGGGDGKSLQQIAAPAAGIGTGERGAPGSAGGAGLPAPDPTVKNVVR